MMRFGINSKKVYGVRIPELRRIAKEAGKNHELAAKLWDAGYNETKILASLIEDPKKVTEDQMDKWVIGFNSWISVTSAVIIYFIKLRMHIKKFLNGVKGMKNLLKGLLLL